MRALWSEVPGMRWREIVLDAATVLWIGVWTMSAWRIYEALAGIARRVALIRDGGLALASVGEYISEALAPLPLIGPATGVAIGTAFRATGYPFIEVGGVLERLFIITFALLALIILVLPIALWLNRYLPWRVRQIRALRAARQVIRVAPRLPDSEVERLLASRALHRLSYETLLRYSPDPFGDWVSGRYDRLARSELASIGLRSSSRPNGAARV